MSSLPSHLGGHKSRTHIDVGVLKFARDKLKVKSMLDIGCGPGGMVNLAKKLELKVLGIDGDDSIVRENETLFQIHVGKKDYNS